MPLTYPPAGPTQSGDITSIHQLLQSPALLQRRLRTLAEHRFIADVLLPQRYPVEGGAIQYQQGESIFTDRTPQQVAPGTEYPRSGVGHGPVQIAEVVKWGQDIPITDESIKRMRTAPLNTALAKLVNTIVRQVDSIALAAISSQVTATRPASALWTGSTAVILRDILLAISDVRALNQGFEPDLVHVDDITFAYVASDASVTNALARETGTGPVYTGSLPIVGGLRVVASNHVPPGFATSALVLDSTQLGGMADEQLGGPGYAGGIGGVEAKTIRKDSNDSYDLRARRVTVPVIVEPTAAIQITGVRA